MSPEELAGLLDMARTCSNGGDYLEVGTAAGGTLREMMKCFDDASRPRFVVVDPMNYFADQLEIVRKNLRSHDLDPAQVDFRVATSVSAFTHAEDAREAYDFMLIDGAHKIRYVTQDLRWLRLLKPGGVACIHDYNDRHEGVKLSVDRFLRKHPNYRREQLVGSLMILRKSGSSPSKEITFADRLWASALTPFLQLKINLRKRLARRA